MKVLLDARLAVRGLGIATFVERLVGALEGEGLASVCVWKGSGGWSTQGKVTTLARSGLFDVSPGLDPRSRGFDAIHYVSNIGSIFPGDNSVVTVHDLLYRRNHRLRDRVFGQLLEQCLPRAGRIVAVSRRTGAELQGAFPSLASRIEVIPHGMRRLPPVKGERAHILAFGGAGDPRKRTDLMVEVYRHYRETADDPRPLVVLARAGLTADQRQRLDALGADIVDDADSRQVDQLLSRAAALLYTTTAEGFGLPILEAAEAATPVVLDAQAQVATEVVGSHCVQVTDDALGSWATALEKAVVGGAVPDALDLPAWSTVAARYLDLYREVSG